MNNKKGISLIVLVITIVVMIILAGAVIISLTNSGIIDKAKTSVDKYTENETCQIINTSYLEYQMERLKNKSLDDSQFLEEKLEGIYGDGNIDIIDLDNLLIIKITINGKSRIFEYNTTTSTSSEVQKGINYNGKNPSEIVPGDDITIATERFIVFSVSDNKIMAMPYNNITLTETPVQSIDAESIEFSSRAYWSKDEQGNIIENWDANAVNERLDIEVDNSTNLIRQYAINYKTTLESFGASGIEVDIPRYSDLYPNSIARYTIAGMSYWIRTVSNADTNNIYVINKYGDPQYTFRNNYTNGVRPLLIITIN